MRHRAGRSSTARGGFDLQAERPRHVQLADYRDRAFVGFQFQMAVAAGGLVLSGDDLSTLPGDRLEILKKMLPPAGVAAEFENERPRVGVARPKDPNLGCVLGPAI